VKFWDTSAVVPLCVIEPSTGTVKSILTRDSSIVVWWAMCLGPQPANPRKQLAYRGRTPGTSRPKATRGHLDRSSAERNTSWDRGAATSRACSQSCGRISVSGGSALVSKTADEQRTGLLRYPDARRGIQRRIQYSSRPDSLSSIHKGTARKFIVRVWTLDLADYVSSSSNSFAAFKSAVSNPSVNQP
jgi:hypothetical protein